MDIINKYFPNLTDRQKEQIAQLDSLYREWNAKINVISRKDIDNLYEHHVLHSMAIAKAINFKDMCRIDSLELLADAGVTSFKIEGRLKDINYVRIDLQSKTYSNWFPSLALSLPVGKTQMQLTYAADIYRPSYNELRSGVQYDNQYTYESGNPFLTPSITRNLTYAFSWKWVNLQLIYSHISDEVCTMTQSYQNDPIKSLARPENINGYNSFQAGLTLNPTYGIWHPTLEAMLYKQWLKMDTHVGNKLTNPVAVFSFTNTFDFKWLTASLVMTAQTEGNMGNKNIRKGYFNTDLSLYKALFKNRLTLTLDVSDLFATGNQYRTFYSGAARTLFYDAYSVSSITLGIRYRFNATNSKYKGTGAGQSQKSRM